jgi:ribosomal protein S18 acetylase RimI-like enzyme
LSEATGSAHRPADSASPSSLVVRSARESDREGIAAIGSQAFRGLRPIERAQEWVDACWRAAPRMRYWVAEESGKVRGYILWVEKGGFREDAVLELEQVAVDAALRGRGIGAELVTRSLAEFERDLLARGARLKLIEVTTGTDQGAVDFYRRTLGAEVVATLPNLFHGDELILIARR